MRYHALAFFAINLTICALSFLQCSSSTESLDGPGVDYAKSYDAVVFDVLKVTPGEFAVSIPAQSSAFWSILIEMEHRCMLEIRP